MNRRALIGALGAGAALAALPARPRAAVPPPIVPLLGRAKAALDRHHDSFELRDRVAIADFSLHSRELRFHIADLIDGRVISYLVAHGKGSDPEHTGMLQTFSNVPDSLATCSGAFRTTTIFEGQHGQSMRLIGLDETNNNAEDRAIIVHGAWYVSENHLSQWGKLGRSDGCFAVAEHRLPEVLAMLGPGRLIYADRT